jgi:hypothetical protein
MNEHIQGSVAKSIQSLPAGRRLVAIRGAVNFNADIHMNICLWKPRPV